MEWIETQRQRMCRLVTEWSSLNTGSYNRAGLDRCADAIAGEFSPLGGDIEFVDLPPQVCIDSSGSTFQRRLGRAIRIRKRRGSGLPVFLGIHYDTVFGPDDGFQNTELLDENTLRGPGVADAKGGLVVMRVALEALERSGLAEGIGWEVFINPDEEIGSPGSAPLLAEMARDNALGLLYEPALEDGALAGARKGSGNYTVAVRGREAHAGRDFHTGRNAIHALAELIVGLNQLNGGAEGVTVNVGRIEGGGPVNVVPALAIGRFNARVTTPEQQRWLTARIDELIGQIARQDGIRVELHGGFASPPKLVDEPMRQLLESVASCGRELGIPIHWRSTGGACDGNKLAAAGLVNVDSLGVRGGHLHSNREFLILDSLTERARLSALLLMKLASGEIDWPPKKVEAIP
ncbi:MAG: hydrolase [Tepidisphaerales bacterium]